MDFGLAIQIAASVWLIAFPPFANTHRFIDRVLFKVLPALLGTALAFNAYGQFIGVQP